MKKQINLLLVLFFLQCLTVTTLLAQAGLIASYPFKGNAHDETGNGYNGTVSGATLSDDRFGNPMSAYSFDGINDKIVIGKEPNFPSWDTYAVSVWFLNDGGGDQGNGYGQKILSKAQFYTDFHLSVYFIDGRLIWWSAQGGFNSVDATNQDYRDNQWHHVVLNKNSPGNGDIWVDGVLQNSSNTLQAVFNNEDLVIGFTTHSDGYQQKHWSGKIDDIRIYNGVLSESEISDLFTEGDYCLDSIKFYKDGDSDKYGNVSVSVSAPACEPPAGYVSDSTDCNDADASIHPGAFEIIGDGIDNNCNGLVDEKLNNALNFDGADDRVLLNLDINPAAQPILTFEAWVYRTGTTGEVNAIISNDNGDYDRALVVRADQKYHIHAGRDINTGISSNLNTWEHVAVTWSASAITFIKNGVTVFSTGGETITAGTTNTGLGNAPPFDYPFQGNIDEVRIWNVARTKAEIQAYMHTSICNDANGLIAYYPLNQGIPGGNNAAVTTADDVTSNNHDGTLHNFALIGATSNWVEGVPGVSDSLKFYKDGDSDKYGNISVSVSAPACEPPAGYVLDSADCNDKDASIHPGAFEIIGDGIDNNCNGLVDEKLNNALNFDGADDRVLLNLNINPAAHPILTFEAWVYRTGTTGEVNAIISNDNGGYDRAFEVRADQKYHIHAGRDINTGISSNLNTWEHVAVTWSASAITFIKNGVTVFSTGGEIITAGTTNTGLGNAPPFDYPFQGSIDEVRIWNIARTQAEIRAGMTGGVCGNAKGLIAYYPFNQGIAGGTNTGLTTADDITSKNHDGTLHNFALTGATSNWVEGVPGNTNTCPAPTGLTVRHVSDTCAVLSWDVPCTDISYVQFRYRAVGETAWVRKKKDAAKHIFYINELTPNTTYQWQLRSLCTEDTSGWVKGPDFTTLSSPAFSSDESIVDGNKVQGNINAQVMPNPSNGNFSIQLQLPAKAATTSLALYNNMGEKVWQQDAGKISGAVYKNISLQNQLPAGIYMMVIQRNDVRLMRKIVISK